MNLGIAFAPLVPMYVVWTALGVAAVIALLLIAGRIKGALIRTLALALFVLALANPSFTREDREPLTSVAAVVIDVIHPGIRATGASVLSLFQNLLGLAAGPLIAGVLSDVWTLEHALIAMPVFGLFAAWAFMVASRSYEADLQRAGEVTDAEIPSAPAGAPHSVPA